MGKMKGIYNEEYPVGTVVKIVSRKELENFRITWEYHHQLEEAQLSFADQISKVKEVSFYHGGDELYVLEDITGIWHECCLRAAE